MGREWQTKRPRTGPDHWWKALSCGSKKPSLQQDLKQRWGQNPKDQKIQEAVKQGLSRWSRGWDSALPLQGPRVWHSSGGAKMLHAVMWPKKKDLKKAKGQHLHKSDFLKIIYFIYFFLAELGLHCSARASHCGGVPCCWARALGPQASVIVSFRLSSCAASGLVAL